ncbi:MAG: GGDEF domain-containing protein [Wenzhouxiangella sp.]|jgi:diguanylate cyclase (GGDEF)-like protein|nr:GGDEF domain-containing protein [Wenzhouxiangella sp.]
MNAAARSFDQAKRNSEELLVAIVDADYFKRVNDQYGHHIGDQVLMMLAEQFTRNLSKTGLAARLGGEEFAVLQAVQDKGEAEQVLEKLRTDIAAASVQHQRQTVSCTVSIGATVRLGVGVEDMLARADKALYRAKDEGRNRVVID